MISFLFSIFIKTNYGEINVHIEGKGKDTVVMIHGLFDSWHEYHRMIPFLKENFVLVIPDLLGHGSSDNSIYGYSPMILAASLIVWADNKRVKKLFLITPANTVSFKLSFFNGIGYSYPVICCISGCILPSIYKRGQKKNLYYNKDMYDEEHSEIMYEKHFSDFTKKMESVKITKQAINRYKFDPLILKSMGIPVFVIFTEKDRLINKDVVADFEKVNIPYEIYEDSGHELTLETPERLSNSIIDFFRR